MLKRWVFMLPVLTLLAACASRPDCLVEEGYQNAEEFPALQAPAGMTVPPANPNLAIPQVAEGPVGYIEDEDAPNSQGVRCLQTPPRFGDNA